MILMTLWEFYGSIMDGFFDAMQYCTLFYGISLYDLFMLGVALTDLGIIVSSIFRNGEEVE